MFDPVKEAAKERNRIRRILAKEGVPAGRIEGLRSVIENTAFIKAKLDEARADMADEPMVVEYDNGGGQSGIRENPIFRGYESLWKAYLQGMDRIFEALPQEVEKMALAKDAAPKTVLQLVRDKHRQQA